MTITNHVGQDSGHESATTPDQCPHWCEQQHEPGEPHSSAEFDVQAIGQSFFIRIAQADGDEQPRVVLENNPGPATPFRAEFELSAANDFADVLGELWCIARKCHCWGDALCPGHESYTSYEDYKGSVS